MSLKINILKFYPRSGESFYVFMFVFVFPAAARDPTHVFFVAVEQCYQTPLATYPSQPHYVPFPDPLFVFPPYYIVFRVYLTFFYLDTISFLRNVKIVFCRGSW